jgi:orotate phosphoribosyltransferase
MPDKIAENLLKLNAVVLRTEPPFRWTSGILSPIYTDNRILMSYPDERSLIVDSFINLLKKEKIKVDGFAGTATAGIAWAAWLAHKMKKPMVYVRSEAKSHGKQNKIEGKVEEGKSYIVVEDLISTGGSSINTIDALREKGAVVEHCIAIFTYELEKSVKGFEDSNVALHTLTNFTSLIETAAKKKYIKGNELNHILDWKKNPEGWTTV